MAENRLRGGRIRPRWFYKAGRNSSFLGNAITRYGEGPSGSVELRALRVITVTVEHRLLRHFFGSENDLSPLYVLVGGVDRRNSSRNIVHHSAPESLQCSEFRSYADWLEATIRQRTDRASIDKSARCVHRQPLESCSSSARRSWRKMATTDMELNATAAAQAAGGLQSLREVGVV